MMRYSRSLGRIEAAASETAHIEGNGGATTATWMNDTGISVCSANVATIGNQNNALSNMLKRPSDLLIDGVGYEKRVKLESSNHQEDHNRFHNNKLFVPPSPPFGYSAVDGMIGNV
uniref:Uncharacterized protein n=1 Tax=Elaeophora elaphi TaxID=1147741 RepID=A0A0R3S6Y9_9BILA